MSTDKMREALVMARAGLVWYQENYPQTFSECDNEALEQIDAALSQSEPECCPYCQGTKGHWEGCKAPSEPEVSQLRDFLTCMQQGEMTVSRGMELLTEWVNGSYSDSMLPDYGNQPSLVDQLANAMQMHADVTQKYIALAGSKPEVSQPVAVMWQNEETGNTGFIDMYSVGLKFFENNPRLKRVCFCYTSPPDYEALKAKIKNLEDLAQDDQETMEAQDNAFAMLKLRVAELEADKLHLQSGWNGATAQAMKNGGVANDLRADVIRLQSECDRLRKQYESAKDQFVAEICRVRKEDE